MASLSTRLGKNIAAARKECSMTQARLAEVIGVDSETISRFERGFVTPSLSTLENLSAALNVSMCALLEGISGTSQSVSLEISHLMATLNADDRLFLLSLVRDLVARMNR